MIVDHKSKKIQLIVLKPKVPLREIKEYVEQKKTSFFRHLLTKPKKSEVHAHSINLTYEPYMIISGTYNADFYRKAKHPIKVDHNVKEVKLGDGIFPISQKSTLRKKIEGKRGKNTVNLELEEHVLIKKKKEIVLDHHGIERDVKYKTDAKNIELYPKRILKQNLEKDFEITHEAAIKKLGESLREESENYDEVRDMDEHLVIGEITELYVPIYEARLVGPKKKVKIMRVDAVMKKII